MMLIDSLPKFGFYDLITPQSSRPLGGAVLVIYNCENDYLMYAIMRRAHTHKNLRPHDLLETRTFLFDCLI